MNELKYLYEFRGSFEIIYEDKLLKIRNKRIIADITPIYLNNSLYLGNELNDNDEISFNNERIVYFKNFILSSISLPLKEFKPEFEILKNREEFIPKFNDQEIKPVLEINLSKVNLIPNSRSVAFISFLPMVMMSLASLSVVLLNIYQKNEKIIIKDNIGQLLLPAVMLVSTLVLQPLIRFEEKHRISKENRIKINDYKNYLLKTEDRIKDFKRQNNNYLNNIYLEADIINKKIASENIFQYQRNDSGYLVLSLGYGNINLNNLIIRNNNQEENEIGAITKEFIIKNTRANQGPILLDLKKEMLTTLILNQKDFGYADFLLMSLFTVTNPLDLKIAALIQEEYLEHFNYLYEIRHFFYDYKCHIFKNDEGQYKDAELLIVIGKNFKPKLNEEKILLTVVERKEDIPARTKTLITVNKDNGTVKRNDSLEEFHINRNEISIKEFIRLSHRYDLRNNQLENNIIPLTDLYPIDYSANTLKAVLGKNDQGAVTLDLDETKDGPHGLVVGMTGSGKSELLLTMVLSLSLNYSPLYVNFVIVDFKGGGIVNILNNKERKLKHLVSSLTNIDSINFERILVSFKNEIYHRQLIFKEASDVSGENITNIKEYQMLLKRGAVNKPMPHLIIILDEFAEIKKEHSEVIDEFLSISRVGRSLGLHLILCTQRAQGVIDDEIKSNAGFKICLKVNSKEDSREVIESDDAVEIKEKGGFYLLTNNHYVYGKSAYTNADIHKSYLRKTELLDQNLEVIDHLFSKNNKKSVTEASKIIDVLNNRYKNINLDENKLWLDPLYAVKRTATTDKNQYQFGIIDDYRNKKQYPAAFSIFSNNLVVSMDKKKKEQHLINCLNDLNNKDIDVWLLNFSKYRLNENINEINEKNEYELNYFINLLINGKERFKRNALIIISDLKSFLSLFESSDLLKRIIEQSENYNYRFLIYANSSADYTYSFSILFEHIAYLGDLKSDEILNIYSRSYRSESINDGLIEINELEEFKLYDELLKLNRNKRNSLIKYIPDKRKLIRQDDRFLIGYTTDFAEEFYLDLKNSKQVMMTSYDDEKLDILNSIFKEYKNVLIVNADELRNYKKEIRSYEVLFFGSGITDNYDLNAGIREDLEEDELLYIYKKKKVKIKYFNEWN